VRSQRGRIAVTCFASNVVRLESVALAARDAGRRVVMVGRSLRNIEAAARECGYLKGIAPFGSEDDAGDIPDDNLLMLVTGSQGEPRSALARIALDQHPRIELGEGDTVVFSSRVIPGNERAIGTVQDNLVRRGVRLMTDADHAIHVSGHPARDELRRLYRLVKPPVAVPVHGEWRHLSAHAELAQAAGATPVLLGAAAVGQAFSPWALLLFGMVFLWQFPHSMAVAWRYRQQFAAAGVRLAAVTDPTGRSAGRWAMAGAAALLPLSLAPLWLFSAPATYGVGAGLLGAAYLGLAVGFARRPDDATARRLLLASLVYLPALFAVLLLAGR